MRYWLIFSLLLATLPACSQSLQIRVEENKNLNSKQYLLQQDDCRILWRLQFFQSGKGFGIREEAECPLPVQAQIPLRQALLKRIANDTGQMQGVRNFVWGSVPNQETFMPRLKSALIDSGQWDASTGRPRGKAAKDMHFMRDLMNRNNVFAEVTASFAAEGWNLRVEDVEKLQISETTSPSKYPVNCALVFSIHRTNK